ncbi:Putative addiction module component [Dyadobacter soli]|uniref:Putative addiction module component n=1 Tax=Dyadobacter soli TaxID=659014 RepID=A0A1G7RJ57_9BACT|nr:addiction module protein [Dyadobacter soli]SDG10797.1 Putative addiction module component [Dyadobacter soli]
MNTQQLSLDQVEALVKNLEEVDNTPSGASQKDFELSSEGLDELRKRLAAFDDGKLAARPWNTSRNPKKFF